MFSVKNKLKMTPLFTDAPLIELSFFQYAVVHHFASQHLKSKRTGHQASATSPYILAPNVKACMLITR